MDLERIVVVGASLAGLAAAEALRAGGFEDHLVVVDGAEELPADRPPLSKQVLAGTMAPTDARQPLADRLDELDVDLRLGNPVEGFAADDLRLKFRNDHELSGDAVVVATGASPRRLGGTEGLAGVHVVRDLADALALKADLDAGPRRVVVVGAGFIGAEVAATARGLGLEVTLLEGAPAPLVRVLPTPVGEVVAQLHRDHGVDVRCGVGVDGLVDDGSDPTPRVGGVRLADGEVIDADVVVVGIGVAPSVTWLEGSGLTLDDGVRCDATLAAAPGVWAAGDVARWDHPGFGETMRVEHWDHAIESGAAAARNLLAVARGDAPEPFAPIPWFWSDQYDRKIQMAGRPAPTDELVVIDGELGAERFAVAFRRGDRCTGVLAVNRPRAVVLARMKMAESLDWDHVVGPAAG